MNTITVCRQWNNPQISISINRDGLTMSLTLEDFLRALVDEVAEPLVANIAAEAGNPAFWFTNEALTKNLVKALESTQAHQQFVEAADKIIERVKMETAKVM